MLLNASCCSTLQNTSAERTGLELPQENAGKTAVSWDADVKSDAVGAPVAPDAAATPDPDLSLLVNAWLSISLADRKAIMAIVLRAAKVAQRDS